MNGTVWWRCKLPSTFSLALLYTKRTTRQVTDLHNVLSFCFSLAPSDITHVRFNPESTSTTTIGFTWQPLTCRNQNGNFWYYYARIFKNGDRSMTPNWGTLRYMTDISYSSIQFDDLDACTMYELIINAKNRDAFSQGKKSYATGVTGFACKCKIVQR